MWVGFLALVAFVPPVISLDDLGIDGSMAEGVPFRVSLFSCRRCIRYACEVNIFFNYSDPFFFCFYLLYFRQRRWSSGKKCLTSMATRYVCTNEVRQQACATAVVVGSCYWLV